LIIFIHHQLVEHVKRTKKELNYILTKLIQMLIQISNVRRLTVSSFGSSKLKYS